MKGGSQSILIRANDGKHYVVKLNDNPQGPHLLANEHMGSAIAKAVGIPVAESKAILFSQGFIDSHPPMWFELPSGLRRPKKGLHAGSLMVGQPSGPERPTEYISPSRINTISNREAFLGMYLLDVWANHQDSRQAIFKGSSGITKEVKFIDHGHMFGGPEWNFRDDYCSPLHSELAVYTDLWQDDEVALWIAKFQSVIPGVLGTLAHIMEPQWHKGDLIVLFERLNERLVNLGDLVQKNASRHWRVFEKRSIDDTLRLPDSGIHDVGTSDERGTVSRRNAIA
jgi:hypothetical protein